MFICENIVPILQVDGLVRLGVVVKATKDLVWVEIVTFKSVGHWYLTHGFCSTILTDKHVFVCVLGADCT